MRPRFLIALAIVLGCGLLIVPQFFQQSQEDSAPFSNSSYEAQNTANLIKKDVQLTDQLCRTQCALQFDLALSQIHGEADGPSVLNKLQQEHPNMIYLQYNDADHHNHFYGKLPENKRQAFTSYMEEAKQALKQNRKYQSPTFNVDGKSYFVIGQTKHEKQGKKHQLIGVIQHDLLEQVQIQQKRNFRVVPYPNESRSRMQTMDVKTNEKKNPKSGSEQKGMSHFQIDEVVVKFTHPPTESQLEQIRKEIHAVEEEKQLNQTYIFRSDKLDANEMLNYFKKWEIDYAEPHFLYLTNQENETFIPNDELFYSYQWNLPVTDTLEGWNFSRGSEDVIVAVIDTGIDTNHSDLQGQLTEGLNVINGGQLPADDVGHGTHVAGVISALVNNNEGVAGMSWYNKVMPIKVLDHTGAGTTYAVAQGIIWAVDQGARVINLSLGNYANAAFLHDAIKYAYERDVVLVAATGNDGTSQPGFPAAYPEVLAVSAIDSNQSLASFSNYGDYIDVVAPGVNIASTYTNNRYAALSGTSMASPHAAALAAMIRSVNPELTNDQVMQIIRETAIDLGTPGRDANYGYGQINVAAALMQATGQHAEAETYDSDKIDWKEQIRLKIRKLFGVS